MRIYFYHYCRNIEVPEYYSPLTCDFSFFIPIHAIIGNLELSDQTIIRGNAGGGGSVYCEHNSSIS